MRLWVRLTIAFSAVGLISLLVFALFVGSEVTEQAKRSALVALEQEAALRADRLGNWTLDQGRFLEGWTRPYAERLATMDPSLQAGLLSAVYVAMPSANVVVLVDAKGVAVASPAFAEGTTTDGISPGQRAELLVRRAPIQRALTEGVAIGAPYQPVAGGPLALPMAALATSRRPDANPEDALVIAAEVRLDLASLQESVTADHAVAVISGQGEVLFGEGHPLVDARALGALAQSLSEASGEFTLGERGAIGGYRSVPGTDWTLVVIRPATVVNEAGDRVRRIAVMFFAFAVTLALFLGWAFSTQLSLPVTQLRDTVLAVAEGDYGRRTQVSGQDEIGELARAFNHLSARLAVNRQEIADQHEQIVGFNRELQDRVERRTRQLSETQDQLVRSGQLAAVAEVGAGLAHELNNPLAAILGTTQVLRARATDPAQRVMLERLEEQAQRCREVVGAMLRFASGEEVDPDSAAVVDLRAVLAEVTTLVGGPFRQRGVTLRLEMPDTPLPVRLDPVHGSRILAQILNGLRAALTEGSTLVVRGAVEDDEVVVSMSSDLPVAIDEFRRDDWMASGMGLWVARRLLDQLGGRLEQPFKMPWLSSMRAPATEDLGEDPSLPLLSDATWRVVLPRA